MTAYAFTIDKVQIQNYRSKGDHNDSDLLTLVVTANDSVKEPTGSFRIGDNIHAGDIPTGPPPPPWVVGPYDIGDNDMVTVQMVIMNQSHTDDADKEAEAVKIGSIVVAGATWRSLSGGWYNCKPRSPPSCRIYSRCSARRCHRRCRGGAWLADRKIRSQLQR
jgi:hypothetical protein